MPATVRIEDQLRQDFFSRVWQTPAVQSLARRVESGGALSLTEISPAAQPFVAALLHRMFPQRPLVVVTEGLKTQEKFDQDMATWLRVGSGPDAAPSPSGREKWRPLFYPAWEILPHEAKLPHADVISERLETLIALGKAAPGDAAAPLIITTVAALMQRTFAQGELERRTRALQRGDRLEPLDLVEWLEDQGYEPEAKVTQKGEISLRGGILDIFPLTSPWPVRLEFFGDELESLRHFDPLTQISRESIERVVLPPSGELVLLKKLSERADPAFRLVTLLEHLGDQAMLLLCNPDLLAEHADAYAQQIPPQDPFFVRWDALMADWSGRGGTTLSMLDSREPGDSAGASLGPIETGAAEPVDSFAPVPELSFSSLDAFRTLGERPLESPIAEAQRREFFHQLHRWLRRDYAVHVFCNNEGERDRLLEIWREYGLDKPPEAPAAGESGSAELLPGVTIGALTRGFLCDPARLVVVTDAEVFGRYKVQRARRLKSPHAVAARSALDIDFTDLEEGDFVVHLQHGIGRYLGLQLMPLGAGKKGQASRGDGESSESDEAQGQECLVIEYAPSGPEQTAPPRLYVPVTEAHLVSKYVGTGKARPTLNTLGGTRWLRAKAQAEQAVRDLAGELLSIQAARESQPGHAFAADTAWQREFEAAFLYEETPDQMRAIVEAKKDMEAQRPMDRLICGDVGYGKTEVAIRAAFKAVMEGKQAALLVPTTILAQQHFNTFRERMADYPIRVEQLSRFCTRREQKRVLQQLAEGAVDIVIGTHRLIQSDVVFKDLGLVIIDEEQRFGVLHKEKFKLLRKLVDVLTLSATPIPRTLYLALTGARDMSTIETPPQDRLPVETIIAQYDERIIRDAIQRELNREGQVFYLHNRVTDIQSVAVRLGTLVPKARIVVGHGQMETDELEEVMAKFINGQADVLVSTTIIESGIDIPNANTIIIERADRFGLSDLYQLRGRVGRYKHQAYAYLLLPRHATLLRDVRKRISAIKQYSSLGSGFKIAMRDLEIRGAGNLLGPEQSGHITAVGFDLYCQLLKQSVSALKGEKVRPRVEVQIRLDFLALHPGEEPAAPAKTERRPRKDAAADLHISVPREVWSYADEDEFAPKKLEAPADPAARRTAPAYLPFNYIRESHQRIEIYRKLAQATDKPSLERLRSELRDRFGKIPPAVELLLQLADLKPIAAERQVTAIETKGERLMLTRNSDYLMIDGKFPLLMKKEAAARLREIRKLLLAL
ncbi:MAG: transcription-repair coupling factor [Verrucomicrobiota bacterium]